jgi:hypothetical protein
MQPLLSNRTEHGVEQTIWCPASELHTLRRGVRHEEQLVPLRRILGVLGQLLQDVGPGQGHDVNIVQQGGPTRHVI